MRGLRVLMLGQGRIEFDGQPLTRLMAPKQQAIVYLLAAGDGPLARGRVATLLWGEHDDAAARASLRVALTRLRRWLPGMLDIDDRQIGFATGAPVAVDWREVRAALRAGADAPARLAAAEAWRGPLLDGLDLVAGDAFEHWLALARQHARDDAAALRRTLLQQSEAGGALDEAVGHARGLLEIDDADEPTHMALMRLLAARGQRTAALAQYEACRAALAERLGAKPSAACYALYTRIHAEVEPAVASPAALGQAGSASNARPAPAAVAATPPAVVAPTLLGRDAELALLGERLADPECRWLTITGPGGVGKTRLAEAAAVAFGPRFARGTLWFSGRDAGGVLHDADTLAQRATEHLGADRDVPRALLLVLDNLETVPDARSFAARLAVRVPGAVVLATSRVRVGAAREWLLELAGLPVRRAADGRTASPAAQLFTAALRRLDAAFADGIDAETVERVCAAVGGLPLALEMAAQAAHRDGVAAVAARLDAGAPLADPGRDPHDRHQSLDLVLDDSWARLDAGLREAALRLAWLPAEIDAALAQAVGVDEAARAALRDQSWLQRPGASRLAMHPLQQAFLRRRPEAAALAAQVHAAAVAELRRVLPAVEPFGDLRPADAACAAAIAASALGAARMLADAVAHLVAEAAPDACADTVDRIVALLAAVDRQAEAAALLDVAAARPDLEVWRVAGWALRRGELLNGAGTSAAAQHAYAQAMRLLGLGDFDADAAPRAGLPQAVARVWRAQGFPPPSHPARVPFVHLLLRGLVFFGAMLMFTPQPQPMVRAALLADALARGQGGRAERAVSRLINAWGASLFGHARVAGWLAATAARRPPLAANPRLDLSASHGHAALRLALGHWAGLAADVDAVADRWQAIHATRYEMEARSLAAKLAFYEGRLHEAWRRFDQLSEAALRRPGDAWRAWGPLGQAEVALCLGEAPLTDVQRLYDRAARLMTEMENIDAAYTLRRLGLAARLAWQRGEAAPARDAVFAGACAAARIRRCGFWAHEGFAALGDTLLALRRHERERGGALPPLDEAWRELQRALAAHVRRFPPAAALAWRLHGRCAADDGRTDAAERALRRAVHAAERQGLRVELARSCEALAAGGARAEWGARAGRLWADLRDARG